MGSNVNSSRMTRRGFGGRAACGAMGMTGIVNTISQLGLVNAALAQGGPLPDYKALVVVFLFGGMDSNNVLVPAAGHPQRANYDSLRGVLAIPSGDLSLLSNVNTGDPFGLHPSLANLASLFDAGDLAVVANVGSLAYPIATRDEYLNATVPLPPQLFSHSDQQTQWQSSIPDKPFQSGWGGRVAELINADFNSTGKISMNISLAGLNSFQVGSVGSVIQYAVGTTGAIGLSGYGTNYASAVDSNGNYLATAAGLRLKAFEDIMRHAQGNIFERGYNDVVRRARNNEALVGGALAVADALGPTFFDDIFTDTANKLEMQLKMVAKLIAGREELANQRQIFFCSMGGFDTHQDQNGDLANLTLDLGHALNAFHAAMVALGVNDKVVTCTNSDFTRTFTPNKSDPLTAGSDHGWGGHQIVMGGPVNGSDIFGQFQSLEVGAGRDTDNNRGRWIPTTSVDQYAAVFARWLGVESSAMDLIFPNLPRFDDPFSSGSAHLGFLNTI